MGHKRIVAFVVLWLRSQKGDVLVAAISQNIKSCRETAGDENSVRKTSAIQKDVGPGTVPTSKFPEVEMIKAAINAVGCCQHREGRISHKGGTERVESFR